MGTGNCQYITIILSNIVRVIRTNVIIFNIYCIFLIFFRTEYFGELSIQLDANYKAMLYIHLQYSCYIEVNTAHIPVHTKSALVHVLSA
jgi:hypothetical protein